MNKDSVFLSTIMLSYRRTLAKDAKNGVISWGLYYAKLKKAQETADKILDVYGRDLHK